MFHGSFGGATEKKVALPLSMKDNSSSTETLPDRVTTSNNNISTYAQFKPMWSLD